jgi:glucose/arabinose dehydrogenase
MFRCLSALLCAGLAGAADAPKESDYYPIQPIPNPDNYVLEVGALAHAPDGSIYAATRRGEVYRLTGGLAADLAGAKLTPFAKGLHESLGAAWRDGALYVQQRPELTRLKDEDGDGRADLFETVSDEWGLSGDYHEYAFSSRPDRNGDIWSVFCLTGSFSSNVLWRGWAVKTSPDGKVTPVASGVRSPGGIGFNAEGDVFYTDNQGPWNGSSSLKWLKPGSFQGHPDTFKWYDRAPGMTRPEQPIDNGRMVKERERNPLLVPPAVILPHGRAGQSPTAIVCDTTGGKFGPFNNQLFVGEQCYSNIARVFLEKIDGLYQGVMFPFVEGFGSGVIGMELTSDGKMFAGGSDRGWGARGGKPYHFDRIVWTGKTPFEILEMRAQPDGFTLVFTQPADRAAAAKPDSYKLDAWTWAFRAEYGGPEVDHVTPAVRSAEVSADGLQVRLHIDGLVKGHVHHLKSAGVRSADGLPLLHSDAYYTLNNIPAAERK